MNRPSTQKIAFVAPRFHTNQVSLVRELIAQGHQVRFFTLYEGHSENHRDLRPTPLPTSALSRWLSRRAGHEHNRDHLMRFAFPSPWTLLRALRAFGADAYVIRDPNYLFALSALLSAVCLRRPVIVYTQGPKYTRPGQLHPLKALAVRLLGRAWITPVLGERGDHVVTHDKVHYLPFVIDTPDRPAPPPLGVTRLIAVGKFEPRKHHLMLLDAFQRVEQHQPCTLTLVGECSTDAHRAYLQRVHARIQALGLADRVTVHVNLTHAQVLALYSAHHLFVLPSSAEPAAVSPLEAMAHGLAVACGDGNGTRCYVQPGVTGAIFRSGDADDLERTLRDLTRDPQRLLAMGLAGHHAARTTHHPRHACRTLLSLLPEPRVSRGLRTV